MKKITIFAICIVTIIFFTFIFWKQIVVTGYWFTVEYLPRTNTPTSLTLKPEPEVTLLPKSEQVYEVKKVGEIDLPIVFDEYTTRSGSSSVAGAIIDKNSSSSYLYFQRFDEKSDMTTICDGFIKYKTPTPWCKTRKTFYEKMVYTHPDDANFFSSRETKTIFSVLYILKNVMYLEADKIQPFHTEYISGFIFYNSNGMGSATIFNDEDIGYELVFRNMSVEQIDAVLSNIK